jgi:hypothetical protein
MEVLGCLLRDNLSDYSAGIHTVNSSTTMVVNSTFYRNEGLQSGGAIGNDGASTDIYNSIIFGNYAPNGPQIWNWSESASASTSTLVNTNIDGGCVDIELAQCDATVVNVDPAFADADNGDLTLLSDSACIDAGDNSLVPSTLSVDLASAPRIVDGGSGNVIVDMGAYEFQPTE